METMMNMTPVSQCNVLACAYNRNDKCHAMAITIGDGDQPRCDTLFEYESHTRNARLASVGACKVTCCRHNVDFECGAPTIAVASAKDKADCMMFEKQ